jgi:hypothetical protein
MDVMIARGEADLGTFPREQLPKLVRDGEIKPTDIYWHEGMDRWKPLAGLLESLSKPPATAPDPTPAPAPGATPRPEPRDWRILAGICLGGFIAFILLARLLITPESEPMAPAQATRTLGGSPTPAVDALAVREKALADLRQRLERLPEQPAPPVNTYYYDFVIEMNETFAPRSPWNVVIRGRENVLKPDSEETLSKTEFILTADYTDGEWVYRAYTGTTLNMQDQTSNVIQHDATRLAPPVLVGLLGLKTADFSRAPQR